MNYKLYLRIPLLSTSIIFLSCNNEVDFDNSQSESIKPSELKESVVYVPYRFQNGQILLAPSTSAKTFLVDSAGYFVNMWPSDYAPNNSLYLLEDGGLLRTEKIGGNSVFLGDRGQGGE